ncbi:hypothetical protein [Kitasatospora sp. NPDC088783]|uniref:hypothetical protein n=1 Tax=Kitasatospora sp. NPDC088783 TaxID=3364077 RepID=UPI0038015870
MAEETIAYVVMRNEHPVTVCLSGADAAKRSAIAADTEYTPPDRLAQTEHRWDESQGPEGDMVLQVRSQSSGRWVKTGYRIAPTPLAD